MKVTMNITRKQAEVLEKIAGKVDARIKANLDNLGHCSYEVIEQNGTSHKMLRDYREVYEVLSMLEAINAGLVD